MKNLYKEPLVHFLILAISLFALHSAVSHEDPATVSKRIVVDKENLLTFIQYRTKVFEPKAAAARLDSLSNQALQRVINDYVREEALHREALALGLERDDYVIKRRLIQKMDFVTQGFGEALVKPDDNEILDYYESHQQEYYVEPSITFTHVFFDADLHGHEEASKLAQTKLNELTKNKISFTDAARHGERFLYGMNYVERARQYVESHFGKSMTNSLFKLEANENQWHGPFTSKYGAHLVMVTAKKSGRYPQLTEVNNRVEQELKRVKIREIANLMAQQIIDSYDVQIDFKQNDKIASAQ